MPLLVGLDGVDKMSKSKGNAIGIDEPPLSIFEKLMSIGDGMMKQYFELCTDVPLDEISTLCDSSATHPMLAKKRLARDVVTIYHGAEAAEAADREWDRRHAERQIPDDIAEFDVPAEMVVDGQARAVTIAVAAGIAPTSSEAKRLMQQGGLHINGVKIDPARPVIPAVDKTVLSSGRRKFVRLRFTT
jgi:tyrosyl-tRNA synthetase